MKCSKTVPRLALITIITVLSLAACKKEDSNIGASPSTRAGNHKVASSVIFPPTANMYGHSYKDWSREYMKWLYSKSCDYVGAESGAAEVSSLSPNVYYVHGPGWGGTKAVTIPAGKSMLFPLAFIMNDYPCSDDPAFQPAEGETIEHFLVEGAKAWLDGVDSVEIVLDGHDITGLKAYRFASYFFFTGNTALKDCLDPCITGASQPGALDGYWYMLKPLSSGTHTMAARVYYTGFGWFATTTTITVP